MASKAERQRVKRKERIKAERRAQHDQNREVKKWKQAAEVIEPTRPPVLVLLDLDTRFFDPAGQLRVLPSAAYDDIPHVDLRYWCGQRALYGLPTTELVMWLKTFIAGRTAIEVGSGNGALGRALDIPRTDSHIQDDPEARLHYLLQGQATVLYGRDVEKLEAVEAVRKYNPQVVIGSWVTAWVDPNKPFRAGAGCMYGIKEERILDHPSVEAYVVVGHREVHSNKSILARPHGIIQPPWLRSRSRDPAGNAIFVWERNAIRS
jgi:hypothetical protein